VTLVQGKREGRGKGRSPAASISQTANAGRSRSCLGLSSKWQLFDWQKAMVSMLCL